MTAPRSLLDIASLTDATVTHLFKRSRYWQQHRQDTSLLAGRVVMVLFFEPSTRTRASFEMAALRLGASVCSLPLAQSSQVKGETLQDTVETLAQLSPDALLWRHQDSRSAAAVFQQTQVPLINAGDGLHAHPTQALLDAFTLKQHFGCIEGRTLAIVGDIRHSRVARSVMALLPRLGMQVRLIAPPGWLPADEEAPSLARYERLEEGLTGCDAIMTLRVQKERMPSSLALDAADYAHRYQINHAALETYCPDAVVLHPGPVNRGIELSNALADDRQRCLMTQQVRNGLYMRMACLEWLLTAA